MLKNPGKASSLLTKLQHAKAMELNDALQEVLEHPAILPKAVAIVTDRINGGAYFLTNHMASLILATRNSELYALAKKQVLSDTWTAVKLYEGQYPDPEIERRLVAKLYEIASNDAEPLRRAIADAMRAVGTEAALSTLEAIFFDLEPSVKVRQHFPDALGLLGTLEARSRAEFLKCVALAIEEIKLRTSKADFLPPQQQDQSDDEIPASLLRTKAKSYIDAGDADVAVMMVRRGAESLAKDLYRRMGLEKSGRPAKKMMLEDLLKFLKDGGIPDVLILLLQTLQSFGNFAAHDQGEQADFLSKRIAFAALDLYDEAVVIHGGLADLGQQDSNKSGKDSQAKEPGK
jgi:hypothetical protein